MSMKRRPHLTRVQLLTWLHIHCACKPAIAWVAGSTLSPRQLWNAWSGHDWLLWVIQELYWTTNHANRWSKWVNHGQNNKYSSDAVRKYFPWSFIEHKILAELSQRR